MLVGMSRRQETQTGRCQVATYQLGYARTNGVFGVKMAGPSSCPEWHPILSLAQARRRSLSWQYRNMARSWTELLF